MRSKYTQNLSGGSEWKNDITGNLSLLSKLHMASFTHRDGTVGGNLRLSEPFGIRKPPPKDSKLSINQSSLELYWWS